MSAARDIVVIGLGHADRGDDAIGPLVAAELRARDLPGVEVTSGPRDAAWILDAWRGRAGALVLDCTRSAAPAGTVRRLDLGEAAFADDAGASSHGLGLASAVGLGRALGELPPRLALVGIEGASFALGSSPSPAVAASVPAAVAEALAVLGAWRERPGRGPRETSDA